MALDDAQTLYVAKNNDFYRNHYHHVIIGLMGLMLCLMVATGFLLYQVYNRPLPQFNAVESKGSKMLLIPFDQPNLLPSTILRWASKAATVSYTFDFVNYNKQIAAARPYFTEGGWQDYLASVNGVISQIVQNQNFINGVVSGTPVISNQGPLSGDWPALDAVGAEVFRKLAGRLPGWGERYVWRVQIPFLVTYQSANITTSKKYFVTLSIVQVPTTVNKQGIGIDQFVMV